MTGVNGIVAAARARLPRAGPDASP